MLNFWKENSNLAIKFIRLHSGVACATSICPKSKNLWFVESGETKRMLGAEGEKFEDGNEKEWNKNGQRIKIIIMSPCVSCM